MLLLPALAASLALHAALWWLMRASSPAGGAGPRVKPVAARVVPAVQGSAPTAVVPPESDTPALPRVPTHHDAVETRRTEPAPVPASQSADSDGLGDENFVDARLLSVRPSPRAEIHLPEASMGSRLGAARARLTLFINEDGRVVRVRVDTSDLTAQTQNDVVQVFSAAAFEPGEIGGRRVKSRLQLEVVVEPAPTLGGPGSAGPSPAASRAGN